ncbi:DUF998 domain-containing protein [Micromonospora carbonacea]|uniref:DUF998 domain-containing protein n=1 Tax=Micromonospora carbonacea TaxID=47853 RepID=A0A7H8XQ69_9ACTN|nr:DUF998 domain-containing protein [Micromonospora carbonacea]MBB5825648.1 hypothetical protein [Micromonospora carbonacea]QLD26329.1 DUF998 domain-containing protein [Micromonospora carbonacea]
MRVVPPWALLSAGAAPVFLVGGWLLGAARQPGGFDQVSGTISALAAVGATDRWIMTLGLVGLGLCHCVTAAGLRPLAAGGRALLALGGVATLAVAAFPLPADGGSTPHALAAAVAFGTLALWPALAPAGPPPSRVRGGIGGAGPRPGHPGGDALRPALGDAGRRARSTPDGYAGGGRAAWAALAAGLLTPVAWFVIELATGGDRIGLAERVAAGAEALCPLLVAGWLSRR